MNATRIGLWLTAALATAGCTNMRAQITSSGSMGQPDVDYANTAYQLVQVDNQAGQLATTKASDPRVTDLASQIVAQASVLTPGFQAALDAQNIKPAATLPPEVAAQLDKLRGLNGAAFDRQYVATELAIHDRAVKVFKAEDSATKDGALRTQVETELPAVQDNLAKLQTLATEYGTANS